MFLQGLRGHYESHHGASNSDEAITAAVALSVRHLKDLHLPDKAIDVLDEAGAAQKLRPAEQRVAVIGVPEVEHIVARMARVPVQAVSNDDKLALRNLDAELRACESTARQARLRKRRWRSSCRARGCAAPQAHRTMFAGPTGVEDQLARQLARVLRVEFLRFDMSEYMEKHAVSAIGAPPGYVGYEEGVADRRGRAAHACCCSMIEKAHPDLFAILLQVMDHAAADRHPRPQGGFPPRHPDYDDQRARPVGPQARGSAARARRQSPRHSRARVRTGNEPPRCDGPLQSARNRRGRQGRRQARRRTARPGHRPPDSPSS